MTTLFAFLHHAAAFALFAALIAQFVTLSDPLTMASARRLMRADAVLGVSALVLLGVGLTRAAVFEKGLDYYLHSGPFLAKLALFVAMAVLSIVRMRRYLAWGPALREGRLPVIDAASLRAARTLLHIEMTGVVLILLAAAMMARGVGMIE